LCYSPHVHHWAKGNIDTLPMMFSTDKKTSGTYKVPIEGSSSINACWEFSYEVTEADASRRVLFGISVPGKDRMKKMHLKTTTMGG
jgi:hypothetical protein